MKQVVISGLAAVMLGCGGAAAPSPTTTAEAPSAYQQVHDIPLSDLRDSRAPINQVEHALIFFTEMEYCQACEEFQPHFERIAASNGSPDFYWARIDLRPYAGEEVTVPGVLKCDIPYVPMVVYLWRGAESYRLGDSPTMAEDVEQFVENLHH